MPDHLIEFPYLFSLIVILAGVIMAIFPPKKVNYLYGYRTPRAMKNLHNWTFAQKYAAKMLIIGGVILMLAAVAMEFLFKLEKNLSALMIFLSVILVVAFVFFTTESAIKKFEKTL